MDVLDIKEIPFNNPDKVEVCFGIVRSKSPEAKNLIIIVCSLYSPPRSRKKTKTLDFIIKRYNQLKSKFPSAFFIGGGDINDMRTSELLRITPNPKQIVTNPTRQNKILSVIVTDLHAYYSEPLVLPPVQPDIPGVGMPSDHSTPIAVPYTDTSKPRLKTYKFINVRPTPDSGIRNFGKWILRDPFEEVGESEDPTTNVEKFNSIIEKKIDEIFPKKRIKIFKKDKEWMTVKLQKLRRMKAREYVRNQKSSKFRSLHEEYLQIKKQETKKYVESHIESIRNSNPSKFFREIKKIGAIPGEDESSDKLKITSHTQRNLSPKESAEKICEFFSSISSEYEPLNIEKLPTPVKEKIMDTNEKPPKLEAYEVFNNFKKRKLKKSHVPGDIPKKIKKEFFVELSEPVTRIFNSILETGIYPKQWLVEYVTPIKKNNSVDTEDDLRPISLTADLSRDFNRFISSWLMYYIKDRLDPAQMGGLKGRSITHYLVLYYNFIVSNLDKQGVNPKSILSAYIDFKKRI